MSRRRKTKKKPRKRKSSLDGEEQGRGDAPDAAVSAIVDGELATSLEARDDALDGAPAFADEPDTLTDDELRRGIRIELVPTSLDKPRESVQIRRRHVRNFQTYEIAYHV